MIHVCFRSMVDQNSSLIFSLSRLYVRAQNAQVTAASRAAFCRQDFGRTPYIIRLIFWASFSPSSFDELRLSSPVWSSTSLHNRSFVQQTWRQTDRETLRRTEIETNTCRGVGPPEVGPAVHTDSPWKTKQTLPGSGPPVKTRTRAGRRWGGGSEGWIVSSFSYRLAVEGRPKQVHLGGSSHPWGGGKSGEGGGESPGVGTDSP